MDDQCLQRRCCLELTLAHDSEQRRHPAICANLGSDTLHRVGRGWRVAFNALLNLYAKSGQAARAEATYRGMLRGGPPPDRVSINTTIAAHAQVGGAVPPAPLAVQCALSDLVFTEPASTWPAATTE